MTSHGYTGGINFEVCVYTVYLGYLSEQLLEGLPDTDQPNVVEKVGHKSGIEQVANGWRIGGEGGKRRRRGRRRRRGEGKGRGGGRRGKREKGRGGGEGG